MPRANIVWNRSGIYKIVNTVTGDCYVGSAVNIGDRKLKHFHQLRHNKHHSKYLQRSFNVHGEAAFVFSIIEELPRDAQVLRERETYWIQTLQPKYNGTLNTATNLGMKLSEEAKQKLREHNLRPEVIAKKKAELTGHPVLPETVEKIREARAKQPVTERMLQSLELGRQLTPEQRKGMTGKQHSEDTKRKQSEAAKGRKPSPLAIQRSLEARRQRGVSEEARLKMSESSKRTWQARKEAPPQKRGYHGRYVREE